jgi:chloride channel protein, CIC family
MRHLSKLSYVLMRERKQVRFLLFSGILLGVLVGIIGSLFQLSILWFSGLRDYFLGLFGGSELWQWPASIIFTTVLIVSSILIVKRFAPEAAGSGVQEIEGVLVDKRTLRWHRVLPVKFIAGSLSLSSGLVLGREGPTIHLGSAIGKMLSRRFLFKSEHNHILIAAGAAAGLATAFNAPLSGIFFVVEEMHSQFKYSFKSLQCVIVTAVVSVVVLRIFMGQAPDLPMTHFTAPPLTSLWIFLVFGAVFGIMGVIFNKYLIVFLDFYNRFKGYRYWIVIIILGIVIGILSKAYPYVVGGGYYVIPQALTYRVSTLALFFIFIVRMGTTWASYGAGTPGGIFAPMLALGSVFGMWFGYYANLWFPSMIYEPGVFAVAGMTALFTATVGAPLTGIILVVEMTMNYALIVPLIFTCFSATMISYLLGGNPIYETLLERTLRLEQKKVKETLKNAEKANDKLCAEIKTES